MTNQTPFRFYRVGRNSYSLLVLATGVEVSVLRGKREARRVRDALLASGAADFDSISAVVREVRGNR